MHRSELNILVLTTFFSLFSLLFDYGMLRLSGRLLTRIGLRFLPRRPLDSLVQVSKRCLKLATKDFAKFAAGTRRMLCMTVLGAKRAMHISSV